MQVSEAAGVASAAGIHIQTSMIVSLVLAALLTVGAFFLYRGRQKLLGPGGWAVLRPVLP